MGNIGENPHEVEFVPLENPATEPVHEPAAPEPVKQPEPEQVPA